MAQTLEAPALAPAPMDAPRRMTVAEFDRIPDDAFGGDRVELIEGLIYTKMAHNLRHITAIRLVIEALQAAFGSGFSVSGQLPVGFGEISKVEPDVLVLKGRARDYDGRYPDPATEIALLVEVSDSSLLRDAGTKAALYAAHGVPEYWIVNVPGRTVEVRRAPRAEGYAETRVYAEGESIAVGDGAVPVADVLPKAV